MAGGGPSRADATARHLWTAQRRPRTVRGVQAGPQRRARRRAGQGDGRPVRANQAREAYQPSTVSYQRPQPATFLSLITRHPSLSSPESASSPGWTQRLRAAIDGHGGAAFVIGEAGSGKTALIAEFARRAMERHGELVAVSGSCNAHTGLGDPYLPFREILQILAGDVEAKRAGGTISPEHARRLWALLPETLQALIESGPDLLDLSCPDRRSSQGHSRSGPAAANSASLDPPGEAAATQAGPPCGWPPADRPL